MYVLDRKMTRYLKGVAIVLMVAHHLFRENAMYGAGLNIFGAACKICVGIYAFLSGFGYCYMKEKNYRNSLKRVRGLLERYWLQMLLIFFPLAVAGGYVLTVENVVVNLFSLRPNINYFSWYVYFYIFFMAVIPLYVKLCRKNFLINAAVTVAVTWLLEVGVHSLPWYTTNQLVGDLFDCLLYFPTAAMGYLVAKHNVFEILRRPLSTARCRCIAPLVGLALASAAMAGRYAFGGVLGLNLDIIYVPVFVFGMLLSLGWLREKAGEKSLFVLSVLGTYSTEIWFLHSVFFSADTNAVFDFAGLLWLPQNPMLVFLWCFALCLPVSAVLHWIARGIDCVIDRKLSCKKTI